MTWFHQIHCHQNSAKIPIWKSIFHLFTVIFILPSPSAICWQIEINHFMNLTINFISVSLSLYFYVWNKNSSNGGIRWNSYFRYQFCNFLICILLCFSRFSYCYLAIDWLIDLIIDKLAQLFTDRLIFKIIQIQIEHHWCENCFRGG